MKEIIWNNRRIPIGVIADDVGISFGSCQAIFMDVLGIKRAQRRLFAKLLKF